MTNPNVYQGTHIATNTTTTVFSGQGVLHTIVVNTTAAGTITVNDGATAVAILKASVAEGTYTFDVQIAANLSIITAAASDITVTWAKG